MEFRPNEAFMQHTIQKAAKGILLGQTPFGACIVKGERILACEHNRVWKTTDITAHAEIVAIRVACRKLKTIDLSDAILYSTCEPCPMCFSAIHWARIKTIVYGASIRDAAKAGFNELAISNQALKQAGKLSTRIVPGLLREECVALFGKWQKHPKQKAY